MMRSHARLALFLAAASRIAGHPLCYDDTPTNLEMELNFCPEQQDGACCTALDEADLETRFLEAGVLSSDCSNYYKQLVCGQCHSYSGHLYGRLIGELGVIDGFTMTKDFCNDLVDACTGQGKIVFPTYDGGLDYCEKHTGTQSEDLFWSYPYTEEEIFEPGLNDAFPDATAPSQLISIKQSPDSSVFWLMGQQGEIYEVDADSKNGGDLVIDIGDFVYVQYEEGLLDFAFDPNYHTTGAFYLSYTIQLDDGAGPRNRLSKFYKSSSAAATLASEEVLITTVDKPTGIHAAGWVDFKPSAFKAPQSSNEIFWSTGDGGPQTDPNNAGQDTSNHLGSIMRISVPSSGTGYTIPSGNLGSPALPEICASGFRNPWRCGFDSANDKLYCGDVGHTNVEEIDIVECGENHGWSRFEGSRCQEAQEGRDGSCAGASRSEYTFPYYEYCHPDYTSVGDEDNTGGYDLCGERNLIGHAVIGGYVYHGQYFSDILDGAYIFADNTNKNVYYLQDGDDGVTVGTIISDGSVKVIGFVQDNNGELMMIDQSYDVWHLPCGDLCATTCLEQSETVPMFESEGCFVDVVNDRGLPIQATDCETGETAMSAEICASYCATIPGMEYMAVQFAFECFCGGSEVASGSDYYGRHGTADNCEMPCSANPEETCGGNQAMEVFKLNAPPVTVAPVDPIVPDPDPVDPVEPVDPVDPVVPSDPSYVGCYADVDEDRIMIEVGGTSSSTPLNAEICSALCSGSTFYGTQYGYECWCGSTDDFDRHGAGACDSPCVGNTGETCGGGYSMSVYSNDGVEPVEPVDPVDPEPVEPTEGYLGCFVDAQGDRIFQVAATLDSSGMTAAVCKATCSEYPLYGTQYSEECWCGEAGTDYAAKGEADCDMPCAGDSSEICGGFDMMSVYANDDVSDPVDPVEPVTPTEGEGYLGCFADERGDRVFEPAVVDSSAMSAVICQEACSGFAFYATQYGEECWCGAAGTDYNAKGPADCSMECAGNPDEICGGYDALSVYAN